ncbi:DUF3299 domain-containing protein [uncultured Ferrimonas sp.]|uniref:DUF3299 domain-containing protein n=1 Tax=uncultured Ferrimonas sp. TaxID=432640 RepID=UPI00260B26C2|nr:DUF3299 domain-containing protein [uncultured Ferrimonas sp.]
MNKLLLPLASLLLALSFSHTSLAEDFPGDYRTIDWPDLQPEAERNLPPPLPNHGGDPFANPAQAAMSGQPYGEVIPALNGQKIRMPGFVVPLESNATHVTEFLLVPYFGACVHVPPPPTNQLIYVKYPKGIPMDIIWDAIWVNGTLTTSSFSVDDTSTGYSLSADLAYPYDEG